MSRIAVIGAGAAGLAAARQLVASGHEVDLFEARDRPGGRIDADYSIASHAVELGAEFIHGERVATWDWVREFDAPTSGAAHTYVHRTHFRGELVDHAAVVDALGVDPVRAIDRLNQLWIDRGQPDTTMDHLFDLWPEISSVPLTPEDRALIENIVAERAANDLDQMGTHRLRHATPDDPPETLRHFRLTSGYAHLIRQIAEQLPIHYSEPVSRIRWDDRPAGAVELTTTSGTHRFDRAVITLPLGVLKQAVVDFDPPLPADKQDAIDRVLAGHISKIVLRFDRTYWPTDFTFLWTPLDTQLWWRPSQGQPTEEPVITAFFGGRDAARLEIATPQEAIEEGARQLSDILGQDLTNRVVAGRYRPWGAEPFTRMGYSSLPPHAAGLCAALAAPLGPPHFAGEATSPNHAATVHGAIESGRRAASEVIAALT